MVGRGSRIAQRLISAAIATWPFESLALPSYASCARFLFRKTVQIPFIRVRT